MRESKKKKKKKEKRRNVISTTTVYNCRLPDFLASCIDAEAKERNTTPSNLLKEALRTLFDIHTSSDVKIAKLLRERLVLRKTYDERVRKLERWLK